MSKDSETTLPVGLDDPPPEAPAVRPMPLSALLIAIDIYESSSVADLRGAVADLRAVESYLINRLHVPSTRIQKLENDEAKRTAIIGAIRGLKDSNDIRKDDPILIYYAGHGSEIEAPPGWGGGQIQMIMPHDFRVAQGNEKNLSEVWGLSDRAFGVLIDELADVKGNNIVRVLVLLPGYAFA
jgi:hypothetical protein